MATVGDKAGGSSGHVWVPFDLLEAFMVDVFKGVGVPEADARICADVLIGADKRGIDSHGVGRL
jgi:L-2-hydroxycarboxylate dehydrogenase (NAD+)